LKEKKSRHLAVFNVPQIPIGREFPDELPTRVAFQIYYFSVNEAETPDLRVFCCYAQFFIFSF